MPSGKSSFKADRFRLIHAITTPLGFYVLSLLIIEAALAAVLTLSKLSEQHVWDGVMIMLILFGIIVLIVSLLVSFNPKNLLYGKEEHLAPSLEPSALRDQIEDMISAQVKPECLK